MLNFKNEYKKIEPIDINDPSTYKNKLPPGLSKHWRYTSLDNYNNSNNSNNSINNNNYCSNYQKKQEAPPDGVTLEISYDNFYALGVDMIKKKKYAEELKQQIEDNKRRKQIEREKKKRQDLEDDIRVENERKKIEQRMQQERQLSLPKINKLMTPPPPPPPPRAPPAYSPLVRNIPIFPRKYNPRPEIEVNKIVTPVEPKKYIKYNYLNTYDDTKNFIKERELISEKFNHDLNNKLKLLNDEFDLSMKKLNNEVKGINDLEERNHNLKDLIGKNIDQIRDYLRNKKDVNVYTEHVYKIYKQTKDGNHFLGEFIDNPDFVNLNGNLKSCVSTPINYNGKKYILQNDYRSFSEIRNTKLPYINLSHSLSYSLKN